MDILNKIICSDCLEAIKNFDENSIDAIVTGANEKLVKEIKDGTKTTSGKI